MMSSELEYHPQDDFTQTSGARVMSRLPRFGHGSDFSKLASSDPEEQTDYAVGVLSVSFLVLSLFIFWVAVIVTLKCMGRRRVGMCAGRVHVVAPGSKGRFRPPAYFPVLRCAFMTAGCVVILLSFALVGPGLQSLEATSSSTRKLNRDVKDLITQGLLIVDSARRVGWNVDALDVDALLRVGEACPRLEDSAFVSDEMLLRSIGRVEDEFEELRAYLDQSDMETTSEHLHTVMDGTEYVEIVVTTVEENDWMVRMYALGLNVLVFFMILAAALSNSRCRLSALSCMIDLLILPMFFLAIGIGWFATAGLAFMGVSNADFCAGNSQQSGPAGTMMDFLEERSITEGNIIFTAFLYYQSGCMTDDPIKHLYKYEDDLQGGISSANDFLTKTDEIGIEEINKQCGADASSIIEGVGLIKDNLGILLSALRSLFELASCKKMRPIYKQAFEGTACTDSSGSVTLLFLIMLTISIIGMIMIMLRSAMYPFKKVHSSLPLESDWQDEWEEYQAYLQYMASFVTMWGGNADDEEATKSGSTKTSSESSESTGHTPSKAPNVFLHAVEHTSTEDSDEDIPDEEAPLSPHTPALDASFRHRTAISAEVDERIPLSPEQALSTGSMYQMQNLSTVYTPQSKECQYNSDDDETNPLSPHTPSIYPSGRREKRFHTPNFLSPGTFHQWRRHGDGDTRNDCELPETPLMTSPRELCEGGDYFGAAISPLVRGKPSNDEAGE